MHVMVTVNLGPEDDVPQVNELARKVLRAAGGALSKDTVSVTVSASHAPPPPAATKPAEDES